MELLLEVMPPGDIALPSLVLVALLLVPRLVLTPL
jgi:hypothetical protein